MSVCFKRVFLSVAIFGLLAATAATAQERPAAPNAAPIRLQAGTFTPGLGETPDLPPGLEITDYGPGIAGDYIVQFDGPVGQAQRGALAGLGGRVLGYLPDFAFKVRMTPEQADAADTLAGVAWTGLFHPAYKMSPTLDRTRPGIFRLRIEDGADPAVVAEDVVSTGAGVSARDGGGVLVVTATPGQLEAIAGLLDVAWIEAFTFREKYNFYARVILGADLVNSTSGLNTGYDGSTQTVAVADTGLDDGSVSDGDGVHPDLPAGRVTIYNWEARSVRTCYIVDGDGAQDVDSGHGTHVAVSIGGEGAEPGTAPAAHIIFQAVEDWITTQMFCARSPDGYYLIGLPDDIRKLFDQAYKAGARVHSNSWGINAAGAYNLDSANADDFVWKNPDLTITFSAGNAGVDDDGDGVIDSGSIGAPGTAKNVITVGASENDRNLDYACDPLLEQELRDDATCTGSQNGGGTLADDLDQMADFSSRGPTDDLRIKPDVVAPGTWVLSGYSGMYQSESNLNPRNDLPQWNGAGVPPNLVHKYMFGTSMSNPLVAGAAAVVRDYYEKAYGHAASAALVKATLINTAVDMLDEDNDPVTPDIGIPNIHEGWGRVDLVGATAGNAYVDAGAGLATSGSTRFDFSVAGGSPFKVSLVWSDFPSTESATRNLVNDLDLVVTDGTTTYRGNDFINGWSQDGVSADRVNNVENVYIQTAAAGTWTVEVRGYNVPNGPQPFALVVDGGTPAVVDTPPVVSIANPENLSTVSGTVTIQVAATDDVDDVGALEVTVSIDGGPLLTAVYHDVSGYYELAVNTMLVDDGLHTIDAQATDHASTPNTTNAAQVSVSVDNVDDPPTANIVSPADAATVSGIVTIQVDATDDRVVEGSLTVEVSIDVGPWLAATYVPETRLYELPWDTAGLSDGHTIDARAIDDATTTDATRVLVTVDNSAPPTMHIGDLDGIGLIGRRGKWNAKATIAVHDDNHQPVDGAAVSGTWSDGAKGGASCTTVGGTCSVTKDNVKSSVGNVTFTVDGITGSLTYVVTDNEDPEAETVPGTNGTAIVISQP